MDASRVYVRAWALGCFYSHISARTFRRALTASVDSCAEIEVECPVLGNLQREQVKGRDKIKFKKTTITTKKRNRILNIIVGQWDGEFEEKQVGSMDEEPQVRGCYNFYLYTNQPGNSVGSPLR